MTYLQPEERERRRAAAVRRMKRRRVRTILVLAALISGIGYLVASNGPGTSRPDAGKSGSRLTNTTPPSNAPSTVDTDPLPGMPPIESPENVYAADTSGDFNAAARSARPLVYVPDTISGDVYEIDPATLAVVRHFPVGADPQHIVPSYNGSVLWATVDRSNLLVPIDPRTGLPGQAVAVDDPYNLYFTPDGLHAIVVAEARQRLDFSDPNTMALQHSLAVPDCAGVNHMDFTANGRYLLATCEFTYLGGGPGRLIVVDVAAEREVLSIDLGTGSQPQDVKLSPDGTVFYVSDLRDGGVWLISATTFKKVGFIPTEAGAHGLYVSRNAQDLYVADRDAGAVSVISFATQRVVATWTIPGGGSPDMGNVSNDGRVLWLSGRYDNVVYAFDTTTGKMLKAIPVGYGPHGVCVWPQPGRYSLGHTGIMR